jgi:hypothetical protein
MHGIDCGLDFADLSGVEEVYERCTGMSIEAVMERQGEGGRQRVTVESQAGKGSTFRIVFRDSQQGK